MKRSKQTTNSKTTMIIIAGHATLVDGKVHEVPTNTLIEILAAKKPRKPFIYIRHMMNGERPSEVFYYTREGVEMKQLPIHTRFGPLRYVREYYATIKLIRSLGEKDIVYIGVDPLNALAGVTLRRKGMVQKNIFYSVDYTERRFSSALLNTLYHAVDRKVVLASDQVWNVSQRICAKREVMGLPKERNIFVPNVPSLAYKEHLKNKRHEHTLITLGVIGEQLDFINLFVALEKLRSTVPDIKLKIVGSGPKEQECRDYVTQHALSDVVSFLGFLDHKNALREMSTSGIGLALYNGKWSFNYYGDSMKCREYFCFGLPVVTTDTHSTVEDIKEYKAGIVSPQTAEGYVVALTKLFAEYDAYSKNALTLSDQYEGIHSKLLETL